MRTKNCFRILAFMLLLILPGLVLGQIPQTMSYQGVLTNPEGRVVADGMYTITFNLYTAAKGDQRIWSETQTIEVKNGLFNVALGSANPLAIPFDKPYWLAVTVGDGSEASERMQLTASAYSLQARSVSDSAITSNKIASGQVVRSINSITDDIKLVPGENVTITQEGKSLVISVNIDGKGEGNIDSESESLLKKAKPPKLKKDWKTGGNALTDPNIHFLGTTDGQPLVIRTDSVEVVRIDVAGNVGIGTDIPTENLDVAGKVRIRTVDAAASVSPSTEVIVLGPNNVLEREDVSTLALQGPTGPTGAKGDTGDAGVQGATGPTGAKGRYR